MSLPLHVPGSPAHALALGWALALVPLGFAWGCAHFAALRRGVDRLSGRHSGALQLLGLRLALALLVLGTAARWGARALLALFAGFLLARLYALRSARREAAAVEGS